MRVDQIALRKILPPQFDQRSSTDENADQELLESIKQFGVLEPVLVRPQGKDFEIIAGHRRYRMASRAGLPTLPCIIQKADDKATEILKIHENMHRLDLSHVDQGNTFQYLKNTFSMSESDIAILVNKSVPYISQHLSLINSDPAILKAVGEESITFSAARELYQVNDPHERKRLLRIVQENGATVPVIKSWVHEANRIPQGSDSAPVYEIPGTQPPYSGDPTFPCESCDQVYRIGDMNIVRLCPSCAFSFKKAISLIKEES